MTNSLSNDPRLAKIVEANAALTAPGAPFEIVDEDVLGERMPVFAQRHAILRDHCGRRRPVRRPRLYVLVRRSAPHVHRARAAGRRRSRRAARPATASARATGWRSARRTVREWILTFWAVAALDAVLVAMNGWWTGAEMRNALELTDPKLLIMDEKRRARLDGDAAARAARHRTRLRRCSSTAPRPSSPMSPIAEDDPFILIFTSGTTGRPKAAVLSHRSVISYLMEQSFIGGARGMATWPA